MKDIGIFVSYRFSDEVAVNGQTIHFEDAIVLPQSDYEKLTPEDIETQKSERVANFKNAIENPPPQVKLTKEEQIA